MSKTWLLHDLHFYPPFIYFSFSHFLQYNNSNNLFLPNQFTLLALRLTYKTLVSKYPRKIFFLTVQTIQISIISFKHYENCYLRYTVYRVCESKPLASTIFPAQSRGLTLSNGNTTTREINRALVYPSKRSQRAAAAAAATAAAAAAVAAE